MKTAPANKSRTVVLGIDPGLATTGWGVVEKHSGDSVLVGFGAIYSSASMDLPARLWHIRNQLSEIIQTHQPHVVAIEELYFAKFAVSIAATAQARGVILVTAAEHAVPIVEYNPRAVKMAMTGYGSADKSQMQLMVQRIFKLSVLPTPDDAADALAIALCHIQTNRELIAVRSSQCAPRTPS